LPVCSTSRVCDIKNLVYIVYHNFSRTWWRRALQTPAVNCVLGNYFREKLAYIVLHVPWLKLRSLLISHPSSDICTGSRLMNMFEYKLLSLTYKVLTTSQPDYLHNLISVQSIGKTRSSSLVTLARPPVSSPLQITNCSFTYMQSPYLWNQLPSSFRQPHSVHSPPGSPHPAHITSSQSPLSLSSPITASTFHSRLKTHLFHKSFPP